MSSTVLGVLGVPTSAGSHNPGQEKGPDALRAAGLVDRLDNARDYGNLPLTRHRPVEPIDGTRDLDRVASVVRAVAAKVSTIRADGVLPVVLGGDCTITLGVIAGSDADTGLFYFDGDADLARPSDGGSGVLDTMGVSHLIGDGNPALARVGQRYPLLPDDRIALFGFDPAELDTRQWERLTTRRLWATAVSAVRADPVGRTVETLQRLNGGYLVHFDVDVLDTGRFPLANFPHFNGLGLDEAAQVLRVACAGDQFRGLVITEVNPDHDPDGVLVRQLVDVLVNSLSR